jgi:hypothetical protein
MKGDIMISIFLFQSPTTSSRTEEDIEDSFEAPQLVKAALLDESTLYTSKLKRTSLKIPWRV